MTKTLSITTDRLHATLAAFDAANSQDPRQALDDLGVPRPYEWLYAERMSRMLTSFAPAASESLQLAARAQHLERWLIPRDQYPQDRAGYHAWRNQLKNLHAERASKLMADQGYDDGEINQVARLLRKEQLKQDADCQTLEDVACLVFLQYYLADFAQQQDESKLIGIITKTWRKMSATGQQAALALPHTEAMLALLHRALA